MRISDWSSDVCSSDLGKYLMKKAMESYLPPDILYRPKMGFVTPISNWFRGPLATEAAAIAGGSALARPGWFDGSAIAKAAADHKSRLADTGRLLWQLLMPDRSLARLFGLASNHPSHRDLHIRPPLLAI